MDNNIAIESKFRGRSDFLMGDGGGALGMPRPGSVPCPGACCPQEACNLPSPPPGDLSGQAGRWSGGGGVWFWSSVSESLLHSRRKLSLAFISD